MNPKRILVAMIALLIAEAIVLVVAGSAQPASVDSLRAKGTGDRFGFSVADAGDVNSDGHADVIVGQPGGNSPRMKGAGRAYVFSGATGEVIYVFNGDSTGDQFGYSVSGAGDFNGDGWDDLVVGAPYHGGLSSTGKVYVFSGETGDTICTLPAQEGDRWFGYSVSGAGDVDGQGRPDIVVGDPWVWDLIIGKAYVFSGETQQLLCTVTGEFLGDFFGSSVCGAGDANDDGKADFIVGAPATGWSNKPGKAYVYTYDGDTCELLRCFVGEQLASDFGFSVSSAGDVSADGYDDQIIGAPSVKIGDMDYAGRAYVFSGRTGDTLCVFSGDSALEQLGYSVSGAGDVDAKKDGRADLIVGTLGLIAADLAYLFSGAACTAASCDTICVFAPHNLLWPGVSVSGAGDVNLDGKDDVIIGAPWADTGGIPGVGFAYVYSPWDSCSRLYTLYVPSIEVTSPDGRECWAWGETDTIRWMSASYEGNVNIDYRTAAVDDWIPITSNTPDDGSHPWTIPEGVSSTTCRVRVCAVNNCDPWDMSVYDFSIGQTGYRSIELTSPNGNECWQIGSTNDIEWNSSCVPESVTIELSTDGGANWDTVTESTGNDGVYPWLIPDDTSLISVDCLVRICATDDDSCDTSDSKFYIGETPDASITVISPNGGEVWCTGQTQTINWKSSCLPENVTIEYSTDSAASWDTIASDTPNTGSHEWEIPHVSSDHCLVRVCGVSGGPCDTCDADFTIRDNWALQVTHPNGGDSLYVGCPYVIRWNSCCNLLHQDIRIDHSTDGGASWDSITERTTDDGLYEWTPDTLSAHSRIRVCDYLDCNPADISDANFSILPYMSGDVNNDCVVNVGDVVYLVSYLYKGGPAPQPEVCIGDVNDDGIVNVGDVVWLVSYLYKGGPAPLDGCD